MELRTETELADKKAMEEASRIHKPRFMNLGESDTINKLLPMTPEEGPPLPRVLQIRWPWKK